MIGAITVGEINRLHTVNGEDIAEHVTNFATIKNARVLLLGKGANKSHSNPMIDKFGIPSQGVVLQLDYGYNINGYTKNPAVIKQILAAGHEMHVNATGIKKRSGAVRLETFDVIAG